MNENKKITDSSYWEFIAEYLPYYSSDDRVLWSDILSRYLNGEEVSDEDLRCIYTSFKNREEVVEELIRTDLVLFEEAINAYYEPLKRSPEE
ncbi:MAG: 6-phospho-beta-glucosidase [Bacteroidales bacterium]|nr:6-phospho-beta-glucosidase [Bacteroidales bacterium]